MKCTIITNESLYTGSHNRNWIAGRLCKPGSDFQRRLIAGEAIDGFIAIVEDFGEMIGWARTEPWAEPDVEARAAGFPTAMLHWNTLEAFVVQDYRGRGIATFAAAGLRAVSFLDDPTAAVFSPSMMLLAKKVGLMPTLFREQAEEWVRA